MECPVCYHANVEPKDQHCPSCNSLLSGFQELQAIEKKGRKQKRSIFLLLICLLLLVMVWVVNAFTRMDNTQVLITKGQQLKQQLSERDHFISQLQLENNELTEEILLLKEQIENTGRFAGGEDSTVSHDEFGFHVVKEGESLWRIAEQHYADGFKNLEIAGHNKLSNPHLIKAGDTIVIKK